MKYRTSEENYQLIKGWAQFLDSHTWTTFTTFTTHFELSADAARRKIEEFFEILELMKLEPVIFWVAEPFYNRSDYHIHALIKLNPTITPPAKIITTTWLKVCKPGGHKMHNKVHSVDYDPKRGARYYVAKHLTKNHIDHDYFSNQTDSQVGSPLNNNPAPPQSKQIPS